MTQRIWPSTPVDDGVVGLDAEYRSGPGHGSAPRSGQPWTDAEYEQILAAAREGVTAIDEVAARIGRTTQPTLAKARRLLPVDERSAPADRVLRLLRTRQEDPDYDWQRTTLEEPPPRPVINPPALTGIPGLTSEDLVVIAYALASAVSAADQDVVGRVGAEVQRRGLVYELREYRAARLFRQAEVMWDQALSEAATWVERALPGGDRPQWEPGAWNPAGPYRWSAVGPPYD